MMESIIVLGIICIAMSAVYLLKNRKTKPVPEGKYIWMGAGEDPFRK